MSIDDIGEYPVIYLPYPEMLKKSTADKLRDYVAKGGKLISEGCPGISATAARSAPCSPTWAWTSYSEPAKLMSSSLPTCWTSSP